MELKPDVEALFEFIGSRKNNIFNGYRPAHLVKDNYLTTGVHNYYSLEEADCEIKGTISFITPNEYPSCLQVGEIINMYEGKELLGYATIVKIFNSILQKKDVK